MSDTAMIILSEHQKKSALNLIQRYLWLIKKLHSLGPLANDKKTKMHLMIHRTFTWKRVRPIF